MLSLIFPLLSGANLDADGGAVSDHQVRFEHFSLREGLSQVTVNRIFQDSKGFLWICTDDGLNRFDGYSFKIYNHDPNDPQSLSDNSIKAIWEDGKGFLWIGTFNGGLNKLDRNTGQSVHYKHDPAKPESLAHNNVLSITGSRTGKLWVLTAEGGIQYFDPVTERFTHYRHDPEDPSSLSSDRVNPGAVLEDPSGTLWVGTNDGLNRLDPGSHRFHRYRHNADDANGLSHERVFTLLCDRSGTIWAGTLGGGLNRLDPTSNEFEVFKHRPGHADSLANDFVLAIYQDRNDDLWIGMGGGYFARLDPRTGAIENRRLPEPAHGTGTGAFHQDRTGALWGVSFVRGLFRYDPKTDRVRLFTHQPGDPHSLNTDRVTNLFSDRSGTLWIGTGDNGLNKFDPQRQKFLHYAHEPFKESSLSFSGTRCFLKDRHGTFWVGTQGGGLNRWDRRMGSFKSYLNHPDSVDSLANNDVRVLFEDSRNNFWVGTFGGGLHLFDRDRERFQRFVATGDGTDAPNHPLIRDMVEDRRGLLWIATHGGLNRYDPESGKFKLYPPQKDGLNHPVVVDLYLDSRGLLWIGTFGGGFNIFDSATESFRSFRQASQPGEGLSHNSVQTIFEDHSGVFWIGTWGGGLNRFDRETERFRLYSTRDGLPNNVVYGILEDRAKRLWISTNRGICRFDPADESFRGYSIEDGLQSNEFNSGAYYQSPDGEMFFGGVRGFNVFFPESLQDKQTVPQIAITVFKVFDQPWAVDIDRPRTFDLSYRDNYFSFEFAALDFTNPQKNRYAYKLEGVDKDWVQAGGRRYASYTNLAPGRYRFTVQGSNSDGVWNRQGVSVGLVISPPYWRTWWFFTLEAIAGFGLLFLLAFMQFKRLERHKVEALHAVELRRKTEELNFARDVQLSMLPGKDFTFEGLTVVGRMRPATEVGGDYYDFFTLGESRLCVVWGDATGHGTSAGIIVGMTKATLTNMMRAPERVSVTEMIQTLNQTLKAAIPQRSIGMGLGMALFEKGGKSVEIGSGGMPFPLHFHAASGALRPVVLKCPPLGYLTRLPVESVTVAMAPGDMLLFLSDGFFERTNPAGAFWGEHGLRQELGDICRNNHCADTVADAVMAASDAFADGKEHVDDMTVVVVRVAS